MSLNKVVLKYRTNDIKLNVVLEDYKRVINNIIDEVNDSSLTDELVKVGASGNGDYLNTDYFDRSTSLHIYIPHYYATTVPLSGGGTLAADRTLSLLYYTTDLGLDGSNQLYVKDSGIDHGGIGGLADDDHTQYSLVNGSRAFTGTVEGVTPTLDAHLSTKKYVDDAVTSLSLYAFKTITGITNDVVADSIGDTLTLSSANNRLTIVGTTATDVITFTVVEANIDHDALTNFTANEHFVQTAITNVSTALNTGLLKVTTGTGALSVITDSSSNWNTAYGWGNHASAGYFIKTSDDLDDITAGITNVHLTTALKTNYDAAYTATTNYLDQSVKQAASPTFATVKLSSLTDGYVPYHVADATGLANSPIYTDGTNVGIGTTPGYTLDVNGSIHIPDSKIYYGSQFQTNDYTQITLIARAWPVGNQAFSFQAHNNAGIQHEKMAIFSGTSGKILLNPNGGNVGIGTTGPGAPLQVNGVQVSTLTGTDKGILNINTNTGSNNQFAKLTFSTVTNNSFAAIGMTQDGSGSRLYFGTSNNFASGVTNNAMVIDPSGNVGIGTTAPKSALHVVGIPIYANNAAAVAGGLTAGAFYRTNADPDPVCVVH